VTAPHSTALFQQVLPLVEETLERILPSASEPPARLHEAMRYSVFAGGKRLRPLLCVAGYRTFRSDWKRILPVAAAIELLHTYSLIHDDLPAMDDDDFRRGLPSCHRKFGEGVAILAGDALLTLAFETIANSPDIPSRRILEAIVLLSKAAGTNRGMIGGQVMDLEAEGKSVDSEQVDRIHGAKAGALLTASVVIGATLAEASQEEILQIESYGAAVGLAFQIVDDILDETAQVDTLGKTPGKDRKQGKATYPRLHGIEASRRRVKELTAAAREDVSRLGSGQTLLAEIADYVETRTS
jgi:geranylgeranyl diphosphate synthase type II